MDTRITTGPEKRKKVINYEINQLQGTWSERHVPFYLEEPGLLGFESTSSPKQKQNPGE